jgi:hypothetical protein
MKTRIFFIVLFIVILISEIGNSDYLSAICCLIIIFFISPFSKKLFEQKMPSKYADILSVFLLLLSIFIYFSLTIKEINQSNAKNLQDFQIFYKKGVDFLSNKQIDSSIFYYEKMSSLESSSKTDSFIVKFDSILFGFYIKKVSDKMTANQIDSALIFIKLAKKYTKDSSSLANNYEKQIIKSQSVKEAKKALASMTDEDFDALLADTLRYKFISNKTLNKNFLKLMKKYQEEREELVDELTRKRLEKEFKESQNKKKKEEKLWEKKVRSQFSNWDGSHYKLTAFIKKNMHDDDSYEHIETTFDAYDTYLIIKTRFRGKNAFGAYVVQEVKAKVNLEGDVLEILN